MPLMARKEGDKRLLYPIISKKDWAQIGHLDKVKINSSWKEQIPISILENDFNDNFIVLKGNHNDHLLICGLKPKKVKAIEVKIPACILVDGNMKNINPSDVLVLLESGHLVMGKEKFQHHFSINHDAACEFDKVLSTERISNDFSYEY
jgi:hypothetical protein